MLIAMAGIEKMYKANTRGASVSVLKGIDLSIDKGEMIAIKGSSGAGKSTLLHIIGCLDAPTKGTYMLNEMDVSKQSPATLAQIRNRKLGFVMQHFALVEEDTALQNVGMPLLFGKTPFYATKKLALEQLRKIGIESLANQRTANLSGGEKQRVAIARALVNQPEILLADEPTGALDQENTAFIMRLFRELNMQGKTIIIVTHEQYVADACDRTITISNGQIQ